MDHLLSKVHYHRHRRRNDWQFLISDAFQSIPLKQRMGSHVPSYRLGVHLLQFTQFTHLFHPLRHLDVVFQLVSAFRHLREINVHLYQLLLLLRFLLTGLAMDPHVFNLNTRITDTAYQFILLLLKFLQPFLLKSTWNSTKYVRC
jgi:hypothetical protein